MLMQLLIETARNHGLQTMEGKVLSNNREMLNLVAKLGFRMRQSDDDIGIEHAVLRL
jgi:acetyltransferase